MEKLTVDLKEKSYNIFFDKSFDKLPLCLDKINAPEKLLIITDSNVEKIYREAVERCLINAGYDTSVFVFDAGEENKNMTTVMKMCESCIKNGLDRKSMIIALGGGVTGDMAGFCAAIYMRGIDFVQIPTTLLSQSDSSVGGKTGVDFCGGKNIIGAFHQPKMVFINVTSLKTLPDKEFISGMGEVIKHGIIRDKIFFDYIEKNAERIKSFDIETMLELSKRNCSIKADVVSNDEKENGIRRVLNFGHTVGHAIESACGFTKTHGQCVAFGIICVFKIAVDRHITSIGTLERILKILKVYGFETSINTNADKVLEFVRKDKKKQLDKISFVLPTGIGSTVFADNVSDEEIRNALEFIEEK